MFPPRYQKAEWIDFTVCCLAFVFGKSGALLQKPFAFGQQRLRGNPKQTRSWSSSAAIEADAKDLR
jgi:hypothetical protein